MSPVEDEILIKTYRELKLYTRERERDVVMFMPFPNE